MPRPLHSEAFDRFLEQGDGQLVTLVAFGLFIESESKWASECNPPPSIQKYRNFHQSYLTVHQIDVYINSAKRVLNDYANAAIATKHPEFLEQALGEYQSEARKGHSRFRVWGVAEAVIGALTYTAILILLTIVAHRAGIDLLEIYQKAAGH